MNFTSIIFCAKSSCVILFLTMFLFLVGCKDGENVKKPNADKALLDTIVQAVDANAALKDAQKAGPPISKQIEQQKNDALITKKYGEQWDFCNCIIANDSITDAFEKKNTPETEAKLMARWDFIDSKCKGLTTYDQSIPDERIAHDKKVMKCLKAAGKKK